MRYPSGPVMVWELANRPRRQSLPAEDVEAVCGMCGSRAAETVHVKHTIANKSFTDQYHLADPESDRTCYACAWVCTGRGMDQIRMWTVVARGDITVPPSNPKAAFATDHLHFTSRADMRLVVATLTDPPPGPWLVAVAESGQKHTLPYSVVNYGGGRWTVRMDARTITSTPTGFRDVFARVLALRAAGFTPPEIEHLDPPMGRLNAATLPIWREHATALMPWRASPLLHLAVFLPNKEHMDEYLDRYPIAGDAGRLGSDVPGRDPGQRGRDSDRPQELVGPGADGAGDGDRDGVLF